MSILPSPQLQFSAISSVCIDVPALQITQATETSGLSGSFTFTGDGVSNSGMLDPVLAGAGTHPVLATFTGTNSCSDTASQQFTVWPLPVVDAGTDKFILKGGTVFLTATATGDQLTYKWTPSLYLDSDTLLNPGATPLLDTKYQLTATGRGGCTASDTVRIKVLNSPAIPSAFSPNGDGVNDKWIIRYLDSYPDCEVDIYNRFGEHVFHSTGYKQPWDGVYKGKVLAAGSYVYIVNTKRHIRPFVGSVIIVR